MPEFTRLPDSQNRTIGNVFKINMKYGLSFEQYSHGRKSICRFELRPANLGSVGIENKGEANFEIEIAVINKPACIFDGEKKDEAREFPLAKMASSFDKIRLLVSLADMKPKPRDRLQARQHIIHFLTGKQSNLAESTIGTWFHDTFSALLEESDAQNALAVQEKDCYIRTGIYKGRVVVEVSPNFNLTEEDLLQVGHNNSATRYKIQDCVTFPQAKAKAHCAPGCMEPAWELQVVSSIPGFSAPIVAILCNVFKDAADKQDYWGKREPGVILVPVVGDVLGEASRKALGLWGDEVDEFKREALGFLTQLKESSIPTRSMFMPDVAYEESNNLLGEQPPAITQDPRLNGSQNEAIKTAFKRVVSLIWGPAATGKSHTLANLLLNLLYDPKEKVLHVATRNVAVDTLLDRCIKQWRAAPHQHTKNSPPFVRLWSENAITAHHIDKSSALDNPCHIDNKRVAMAQRLNKPAFLIGRRQLLDHGSIDIQEDRKAYQAARKIVQHAVMQEARAVFCTSSMCRSPALCEKKEEDGKKKVEEPKTWGATSLVFDEFACSTPPELLIPIVTFRSLRRIVLAGDHYQLPPFALSGKAKSMWIHTLFEKLMTKKFPTTLLNTSYRQHSELSEALDHVVYEDKVTPFYRTSEPRGFLRGYQSHLPLRFSTGGLDYKLSSFVHLVAVEHGRQEGPTNGSKKNLAEVEVCVAIIKAFFDLKGFPLQDDTIAVETGYTAQLHALRARFKQLEVTNSNWSKIKVVTADSVQGAEYEVVLFTMVRTTRSRGFLGVRNRANLLGTRAKEVMIYGLCLCQSLTYEPNRVFSLLTDD